MGERIELGDEVQDSISGLEGVVFAITDWLTGCRRITIQPRGLDKDGKPRESSTFDEPSVKVLSKGNHEPVTTGGPRPEPTRGR